MKDYLDKIPLFFIIGRPRSGTTMLRTIFDAHPNVSIPVESRVIVFLYKKYKSEIKWSPSKLEEFFEDIFIQPKIDTWIIDKENLKKQMYELGENATFSRLIKLLYLSYSSFFDKKEIVLLGDKNPGYSYFISDFKVLLKLFPEAKIIHLTRDYRDHFLSMQKMDFEGNHLSLVCYRWKYSFVQIRKLMKNNPHLYYLLQYENLVLNPKEEVTKLCDFLGIHYHEQMIHYYTIKEKVLAIYPEELVMKSHSSLFKPINADNIYGWKKRLSNKQIFLADSITGRHGEEAGYERLYRKYNLWYKIIVIPDIIYSHIWLTYKVIYDTFVPFEFRKNRQIFSKIYFYFKKTKK
jgi:sulfotransferase family protein